MMKRSTSIAFSELIIKNIFSLQFYKYILVGISNAVFTTLLYLFFLRVLFLHYLVAFTISWVSGVLFTYVINFLFIFKPDEKLKFRKHLPKYFVVYCISFIMNIILLKLLVSKTGYDPFFLQLLILPLVIVINFTGFKYWALK